MTSDSRAKTGSRPSADGPEGHRDEVGTGTRFAPQPACPGPRRHRFRFSGQWVTWRNGGGSRVQHLFPLTSRRSRPGIERA
jgi:hypothetical protein